MLVGPQDPNRRCQKVFVGGLAPTVTDFEFREYFSQFGKIKEAQVGGRSFRGKGRRSKMEG